MGARVRVARYRKACGGGVSRRVRGWPFSGEFRCTGGDGRGDPCRDALGVINSRFNGHPASLGHDPRIVGSGLFELERICQLVLGELDLSRKGLASASEGRLASRKMRDRTVGAPVCTHAAISDRGVSGECRRHGAVAVGEAYARGNARASFFVRARSLDGLETVFELGDAGEVESGKKQCLALVTLLPAPRRIEGRHRPCLSFWLWVGTRLPPAFIRVGS